MVYLIRLAAYRHWSDIRNEFTEKYIFEGLFEGKVIFKKL
ncbi:hypothetical protein THA_219 [Thermosipho africanus TCF52B]|uniref:Uncharacterized protein n=1 Tax=Thermosipho africanus (strain TCF52B) TaxID=484019 RepID=B7IF60_THEAB|nr:hypothetical protein THA_219 [Thermosipho africanus TCF52B]